MRMSPLWLISGEILDSQDTTAVPGTDLIVRRKSLRLQKLPTGNADGSAVASSTFGAELRDPL